jgi:hypothetical protein
MDTENILSALREERNRIDAALAALTGLRGPINRRRGTLYGLGATARLRKRTLSAAARKKISDAAKARWAKAKKAGRNSL